MGLAARGARNLTGKIEKIEDQDALAQVRRQARRVVFKAFLAAIPLTLIVMLVPG
ncbi:MAG: hypothetical protein JETCAE01_26400 [Anaerolineaceae bacterium]|nr:MAG: hypothetical protein JETCAE01_26400 [Anaerolineaceae bacterium]